MASTDTPTTVRHYRDAIDVKEEVKDTLVASYFPEIDVNLRNVGLLGLTSEVSSTISEDAFNTGSVVYREAFINRAQLAESIYSGAAIFQLTDVFSVASSCQFLLVLEEEGIVRNAYADTQNYDKARGIHRFFIDKNTTIYVEGIPFTLDYDIEIDIVTRKSEQAEDEYVFTAHYIKDQMINSISDIDNTYVKIIRSGDGYFALEVTCHQCVRDVREEVLNSSNRINYPIKTIQFDGKLAGFDIMYRPPVNAINPNDWVQLETRVVYSKPVTTPFCYYQMIDEGKLQITFNSRDGYWMPEFNAQLEIILYITKGSEKGTEFDVYTGNNINIIPSNEVYTYDTSYLTAAKPIGSSKGGKDQLGIDALQSLATEGYRTALALTTEHDLQEFYGNYKYRYGDSDVIFIKKRDDVYERVYSAYVVMRNQTYIYHTSTLRLALNISDFKKEEDNIYMLDPGYLFTANDDTGYAQFYRDPESNAQYLAMYQQAVDNGEIPYIDDGTDPDEIPEYLDRAASFAEYKRRMGLDDKRTVFELTDEEMRELDQPINKKFLMVNPFLLRFKTDPNLVTAYLTCLTNDSVLEFYKQNNGGATVTDEGSFVQFIIPNLRMVRSFEAKKRYTVTLDVTPSIAVDEEYPIIQGIYDENDTLIGYEVGDRFNVGNNDLRVFVEVLDTDGMPICVSELYPVSYVFESTTITFMTELYTDDHTTSDNKLRLLTGRIFRNTFTHEYYQAHEDDATLYDLYTEDGELEQSSISSTYIMILYRAGEIAYRRSSGHFYKRNADDGQFYLHYKDNMPVYMYVNTENGDYYEKHLDDELALTQFDVHGEVISDNVAWATVQALIDDGKCVATHQHDTLAYVMQLIENKEFEWFRLQLIDNIINMTTRDDILIPMDDVVLRVYTVYKRVYDAETGRLRPATEAETNNALLPYDDHMVADLNCYIWTNEYTTNHEPVTFIRALDSVRIYMTFEDYTEKTRKYDPETGLYIETWAHDIMDIQMYSLPYIRWSIVKDTDLLTYFMQSFYAQYMFLTNTIHTRLRNLTKLDVKFFRTYGCSSDLLIGEDEEPLDVLNLQLEFDMWFVTGTDTLEVVPEVKRFIKSEVEQIETGGLTSLYISNLMRKIETKFDYVDHIRFVRINNYDSTYQAIKCKVPSLDDLSVEERRWYVPEMLVIETSDIIINEFTTQ